jgi:hypothetical protein
MSSTDTKERIVRTLRNADDPALSAKKLAEELDVSVRTINNHVDGLVAEGRVETSQIGNATAYYIPFEDLPAHKKPDHTCARCGREVDEGHDFAKLEVDTYFFRGNLESETSDFHLFCRFCYSDFVSWAHGDVGAVGEYPFVHSWELPTSQLIEVREDPEIETTPGGREHLDEEPTMLLEFVEEQWESGEYDRGVPKHEVTAHGEAHGLLDVQVRQAIQRLRSGGYLFEPTLDFYQPAK